MPRIRCHYEDCVFLEDGYCGAAAIELEPEGGCLTYSRVDETTEKPVDDWEEDDVDDEAEDEDEAAWDEDEDDDTWDDDDDDY